MFSIKDFKGVIPATMSMFNEREELDEQATRELIHFLLDRGVQGFYLCGSTGEGPLMTPDERMREVEIVMEEAGDKVPVVVHVGAISTKLSIDLARHAEKCGATGISSVPPYYYRFSEQQVLDYYTELAASVQIPLIAYNIALAGLMSFDMVKKLSAIPNVAGIKYTDTLHSDIIRMKEEIGQDFIIYSGCDEMAISGLIAGADGIIGSFYNCVPDMFLAISKAVENNDLATAREKMRQAACVIHFCCKTPCYFTAIREIMEIMGLRKSYGRRPFEPFTQEQSEAFRQDLKQFAAEKRIEAEFVKKL